jgi:hypothetical protein
MAATIINPVAIVLFLISIRFLLSTLCLQVYFSSPAQLNAKTASSDGSGFPYATVLWHGCAVFVNACSIGGQAAFCKCSLSPYSIVRQNQITKCKARPTGFLFSAVIC